MSGRQSFEDELRRQLKVHAERVQPNPETWRRVQQRIRAGQRFRWVYAAAGASALAALAAVAVLVLPGVLDDSTVEFGPPIATQPEEGVSELPAAVLGAIDPLLVATDEGIVKLDGGGAAVVEGTEGVVADALAVRPGSTPDSLDAVFTADCRLHRLQIELGESRVEEVARPSAGSCATGPRFSPDGGHLAWTETTASGIDMMVIGWGDAAARERDAAFGLDLPPDHTEPRVVDWVWSEGAGEVLRGFVVLAAKDPEGRTRIFALDLERQGDGSPAQPGNSTPQSLDDGSARVVAYQQQGCAPEPVGRCMEAVTWTLRFEDGLLEVRREDEGEQTWNAGSTVLEQIDPDAGRVWMEAAGAGVLLGDGLGRALLLVGQDDWSELVLPGLEDTRILHAAVLTATPAAPTPTPATEEPEVETTQEPTGESEPEVMPTGEPTADPTPTTPVETADPGGLPGAVAATRDRIAATAQTGDLEALAALTDPASFTYSFGSSGDPAGFWRAEIANGVDVLGQLQGILNLPHTVVDGGDAGDIYVWPFAYDRPYESLSSAELEALTAAVGEDMMSFYEQSGSYVGYRLGIREDGTWLYYVAGD